MEKKATESELEILNILWSLGPASVRTINNIQNKTKNVGYTTTLKIMQIMIEKGLCIREADGRSHIYSAAVKRKDVLNNMITKLLDSAFNGSVGSMALQLLGNRKTSQEELDKIRELLDKLEDKEGDS